MMNKSQAHIQSFGKTSRSISVSGFCMTEKSFSSRDWLPRHEHTRAHFCFVLSGNYEERISSRVFGRETAALVYYPPNLSHSERHFTNGRHFLIDIPSESLARVVECGARLDKPALLEFDTSHGLASRIYREFVDFDAFSELMLEGSTVELLVEASRRSINKGERDPPRWLRQVKEYLHEHLSDPPSLTELARSADVHPTHLARTFRRFERCSAGDYLRRLRVADAARKMISTGVPLVQIALEVGFADQTHFIRSFKRVTGTTPGEFRNAFRKR